MLFDFKQERKIKIHKKKNPQKTPKPRKQPKNERIENPPKTQTKKSKSRIHLLEVLCL